MVQCKQLIGLALLACLELSTTLQISHVPLHVSQPSSQRRALSGLVMGRKGRPKMPAGMGGAYNQAQQQRAPDVPPEGVTNFYLYCRSGEGKPWYPVSMMKGDAQSRGLINAWLNAPFGKGVFKNRLDEGLARSIFESERKLASLAVQQYSMLKPAKQRLEWGFKIADRDVMAKEASGEIEQLNIISVSRDMVKDSVLEKAQKAFGVGT